MYINIPDIYLYSVSILFTLYIFVISGPLNYWIWVVSDGVDHVAILNGKTKGVQIFEPPKVEPQLTVLSWTPRPFGHPLSLSCWRGVGR